MRQPVRRDRLTQVPNRRFIAEKFAEAHAPD
jgi:GGDEF domain-containing protein